MNITAIGAMLVEIMYFHMIFSLLYYLILIGMQWFILSTMKRNLAIIRQANPIYVALLDTRTPPIDGWVVTFLISWIPILNILYGIFCFKLGTADADSDFILLLQAEYEEQQRGEY